ncbi:MAG: 3',5'-cyclic-AMP phosphodiesterase [Methylococcales bacterium]|nr:3',5'-cyclic-AMP phosphodiesterase [Methylococcales bacterium]
MKTKKSFSTILQVTDSHIFPQTDRTLLGVDTEYYFKAVLEKAYQEYGKFDLILVSGDLAQEPCLNSYQRIKDILLRYKTQTVCLPGNHDDFSLMLQLFNEKMIHCEKRTFLKNWQLICMNSQQINQAGGAFHAEELARLTTYLEQNETDHIMIAMHHHCVTSGSTWMDTMLVDNRDEFFECLQPYPEVKLIVTGHVHQNLSAQKQGIRIFSTPATCFQFKPCSTKFTLDTLSPAYRTLKLFEDGEIETEVHYLSEKLHDLKPTKNGY